MEAGKRGRGSRPRKEADFVYLMISYSRHSISLTEHEGRRRQEGWGGDRAHPGREVREVGGDGYKRFGLALGDITVRAKETRTTSRVMQGP